ncbi:Ribosomal Proteins L2 RNA binding domain [Trinorchestia longiramus]|nr:Ribosomal Proteins L2 RNA binding domain [Trinorchestia longiramus]
MASSLSARLKFLSICRPFITEGVCHGGHAKLVPTVTQERCFNIRHINRPAPDDRKFNYKFQVYYPKDGKYTIKHLDMESTCGRNPITGRKIVGTAGKGMDPKYRWVDFNRCGPSDGTVKEEQVIEVQYDPNRGPFIALVGSRAHLRYILATTTMDLGSIIRSHSVIPEIPLQGKPGDSHPIGALALGSEVCHVERFPGEGAEYLLAAGVSGVVKRKLEDGKMVLQLPSKHEIAIDPYCNAVCGQVSNLENSKIHIGSATRLRWLRYYPRSGLWQRKDGYCGKKMRALPPVKHFVKDRVKPYIVELKCDTEGSRSPIVPICDRVT